MNKAASELTKRIIEGHEAVRATGWRFTKGGESVEVELQGVPITEEGKVQGILVLYNDITVLIRLADEAMYMAKRQNKNGFHPARQVRISSSYQR